MADNRDTEIRTLAGQLAGAAADDTVLTAMCAAAAAEIEGRLKEGVSPEDLGSTFVTAAGVLALSLYCASGEKLRSFRAGELSMSCSSVDAESLRLAAEQMLAGALRDRGFGFRGVRG